ncbi:LLM class F420-dependent oxidoreductase, partial [Rhodococcus erythropolis]|nr:LLM class F420-dependent oxidoreductase [Rhodococcus erythropolis]
MLDATTLPDGFDVVLPAGAPLDPLGNRESALRALTRVRDAGATIASCSVGARSVEHYCEQLEELHRIALAEGSSFTTS